MVIVQIESAEGVKNVESIAAVQGVDVLFVGGFSLMVHFLDRFQIFIVI